jgi:epoxyqueuosine reductase QueG
MDEGIREKISEIWPYFTVADATAWDTDPFVSSLIPSSQRPKSILPSAKSVIVVRTPVSPTILHTAPSIFYKEHYKTLNIQLDLIAQQIATLLDAEGFDAVPVARDGYQGIRGLKEDSSSFFSHRHAAYLSGLGTFGLNNTLLTKTHGPRVRLTSIITSAELKPGTPLKEDICIKCGKCVSSCPANALNGDMYPGGLDKMSCVGRTEKLAERGITPCGICIAVCPIGKRVIPPSEEFVKSVQKYELRN